MSKVSDTDDATAFFGGVYSAIPNRLIVGPHTHAETFATKAPGFLFSEVALPSTANRYVISCLLPVSALPQPTPSTPPQSSPCNPADNAQGDELAPAPSGANAGTVDEAPTDHRAAIAQLNSKAADFIAQMNARRQQQQKSSSAGSPGAITGMSPSFSRSVEAARGRRAQQQQGSGVFFSRAGAPESTVRRLARDNDAIKRVVDETLGSSHFLQCAITRDSLDDALDVHEATDFIKKTLSSDPDAVIYMYSGSGRNRASAVAMYYLQREEKLPLSNILSRMPTSTPQLSFLKTLINKDKIMNGGGKASFDEDHYFYLYFTRRYPQKSSSIIRAAIETRPGDLEAINKLLQDEQLFTTTSTVSAARTIPVGEGPTPASNVSFGSRSNSNVMSSGGGELSCAQLSAADAATNINGSFSSAGDDSGPVVLTALDDEMIETICKALQRANVPAGRTDVKESYVRHRRSRNRVLREFLAKDGVQAAGKIDLDALKTPSVSPQRSAVARNGEPFDCEGPNAGGTMSLATMVNTDSREP